MGLDTYWVGGAPAVAQVSSVQVTAYDVATTYKISVGGTNGAPQVDLTALAAGGANATATALASAWNASVHPYCTGVTASAATDTVSFTADVAGVPFVVTKSVSGGSGTLGSVTAVTANSGPNDWSTAANWSAAAAPAVNDRVFIRNSVIPIYWGLAQSGVAPDLLIVEKSFTSASLGLPLGKFRTGTGFNTSVPEYRQADLAIGAAVTRIGEGIAAANTKMSGLIKINLGSTNGVVAIYGSGTADDNGPAVLLRMNHASATLTHYAGKVGLCWEVPGQAGQVATIDVVQGAGAGAGPELYVGDGVAVAAHNQMAGSGLIRNLPTALRVDPQATVTLANPATGTITTLTKRGNVIPTGVAFAVTNLKG